MRRAKRSCPEMVLSYSGKYYFKKCYASYKNKELSKRKASVEFLLCLYFSFSLFKDCNMQRLEEILQDSERIDGQGFAQEPPLSSWCQRQNKVQACWQQARPQNLANLLSAENIVKNFMQSLSCERSHHPLWRVFTA